MFHFVKVVAQHRLIYANLVESKRETFQHENLILQNGTKNISAAINQS